MPIANWPVDANECIRILFRVSDLLVYVSFVLFGQSFERYAGGALLYLPPITLDPQLGPSTGWPSTGFLIETFSLQDRPETVSGQYGPGAYASWLLVLLSSMVASFIPPLHTPDQDRVRVDADIIATNLYAIVASVDLLRRLYLIPFYFWGASFMAAERVVWNASIFSLAIIGPNRGKTLNARMRVQYIALWIFTLSQVLTKTTYFLNVGKALFGSQSGWNYLPELLRRLRDGATTTIPLVIYYRWSAAIPSKFVKLLAAVVFFFCFTYGRILITYYWLFLPLSVDDIATWRLRILLLPARSGLTELDQAAPLITAVLILLWQWKAWKLGLMAVRSAKNSVFRSRSTEEPEIDLEDIPAGSSIINVLGSGGVANLDSANRMQSKFQSTQRTLNLDTAIHERTAFLREQQCLILAEIEQFKCEPLQTTTIAHRLDRLQQDYNRLVEEEAVMTPGPLCDPLDVLPPELWASIMPDNPDDILTLTMVSSRWCQVLLSIPALWSTIIFDNTKEDYWAKAIACLELSRPLEITLYIELRLLELWTEIAPTILAESGRIRSMRFYEEAPWPPVGILDILAKFETLPALRHLHLPLYSIAESQVSHCTVFRIAPRLEQVTGVHFNAGILADPAFNHLRGVIDIGLVDKEMAAALTGMDDLSSLHIREGWLMGGGAHSRNLGPLYLPSVTRFEYWGYSPIHALQFIGNNLVEFIPKFNIRDILKVLMEVGRFPILKKLDVSVAIEFTDRLDPCDPTLARPSSSLRHLQLYFQDVTATNDMAKPEAIDFVAGREEMFTSIFSLLVATIPYAQTVRLTGQFMVDPALKYTRSLRGLQSLAMWPEIGLSHDNEIQRIVCLPYILPPKFLDRHHPLSRLDLYKPALRSHYQVILADSLEELGFLPTLDMILSVPILSVTTLSLTMASPVLFGLDVFPNLQSIELSSSLSVMWASDFFEELILRPNQWPSLENISLSDLYLEWDILILMLERRNFVTESNVKHIKTLQFTTHLPYKLLYPITRLLKGKFVDRPPLIELSIEAIGNHLKDSTLTGCHYCIRTFRECRSKPDTYSENSRGRSRELLLRGERRLGWRYELPFDRVHPDPPLSPEAVQCLEGKRRRRLEFKISCKEAEKEFGRIIRCSESMAIQSEMSVGGYYMDGVFMDTVL